MSVMNLYVTLVPNLSPGLMGQGSAAQPLLSPENQEPKVWGLWSPF